MNSYYFFKLFIIISNTNYYYIIIFNLKSNCRYKYFKNKSLETIDRNLKYSTKYTH